MIGRTAFRITTLAFMIAAATQADAQKLDRHTTAEQAWKICKVSSDWYVTAGIDGSTTFRAVPTVTPTLRKQVRCLRKWSKLANRRHMHFKNERDEDIQ